MIFPMKWQSAFWCCVLPNNYNALRVIVSSFLPVHPWPRAAPPPSTALALWSMTCTGFALLQLVLHSASYGRKQTRQCLHSDWECWSGGTGCAWREESRHTLQALWRWRCDSDADFIWPALSASVHGLSGGALGRVGREYVSRNIFKLWRKKKKEHNSLGKRTVWVGQCKHSQNIKRGGNTENIIRAEQGGQTGKKTWSGDLVENQTYLDISQ